MSATSTSTGITCALVPRARCTRAAGDVFDLALDGQSAMVESVQQDFEGNFHVVVLVDDDPGRLLGPRGPAHRFFFSPDEVEILPPQADDVPAARRCAS